MRHQVLQCCVGLFASELVAKGLQSIIENQELDALAQLYAYYEDVAQLDVLCSFFCYRYAVRRLS